MPNTPDNTLTAKTVSASQKPYVFSRGSLTLTYDLLRKRQPSLALAVRNLTAKTPLTKSNAEVQHKNSDHFLIEFDSFNVRAVVENLIAITQQPSNNKGTDLLAKTLLEDWLALAHQMVSDLPDQE
jgi:hypothetical protein